MDASAAIRDRRAAFNFRKRWLRGLDWDASYIDQITHMVEHFGKLGIVEALKNTAGDKHFPGVFYVEINPEVPASDAVFTRANDEPDALRVNDGFARARFRGRRRR